MQTVMNVTFIRRINNDHHLKRNYRKRGKIDDFKRVREIHLDL